MHRKQWLALCAACLLFGTLAACGNTDSDAIRVMQNMATGTISALNSRLRTAEATLTAMGTVATKYAVVQNELLTERARSADLLARQNASTLPANPVAASSGGETPVAPNVAAQGTQSTSPAGTSNSLLIDRVVTAKGVDTSNGCAVGESDKFSATDNRIWVIAYVRNMKKGVTFTSSWSGGDLKKDYTWVTDYASNKTCINFYIEPKTLGLKAGDYSVNITTPDSQAAPVSFKVQ